MELISRSPCRACKRVRRRLEEGLCIICRKKIHAADQHAVLGAIKDVHYWERHAQD